MFPQNKIKRKEWKNDNKINIYTHKHSQSELKTQNANLYKSNNTHTQTLLTSIANKNLIFKNINLHNKINSAHTHHNWISKNATMEVITAIKAQRCVNVQVHTHTQFAIKKINSKKGINFALDDDDARNKEVPNMTYLAEKISI